MALRSLLSLVAVSVLPGVALAGPTKLNFVWSGSAGTVVFVHGHGNCTNPNGQAYDSRCGNDPAGYWLNSTEDGGDGHDMLDDATARATSTGWQYWEAFSIRYDGTDQAFWGAANDVAGCLRDLLNGTNSTGCNPSLYRRTRFYLAAHSEGGTILDRIFSSGWYPDIVSATQGYPVSDSGALAGAKSASALYGTDGASNFCTTLVSWLVGWALKDTGTSSLTRGTVIGEANNGHQGKSPRWFLKVTTSGGSGSCNNTSVRPVNESVNDSKMGVLCGCIGYSSDDDSDGILWMYDTDPTSNPSGSNGGKYRAQYTGYYWHWLASWANHSHTRNDAYAPKYGYQTNQYCYPISPGTCIGQYAW